MRLDIITIIKGRRVVYWIGIGIAAFLSCMISLSGEPNKEVYEIDDKQMVIQGEIYQLLQKEKCQAIYIQNETGKFLIYDSGFTALSLGNDVEIKGQFSVFDKARNPGNFDAKSYYDGKEIRGVLYPDSIEITNRKVFVIREKLRLLREKSVSRLYQLMGTESGSVLAAMILGDKEALDEIQEEKYQQIGVGHIFAISGLHISILSLFLYEVVRRMSGEFWVAGTVVGVVLVGYVVLTGVGLSAVRAGVMFGVRVGADITGRAYDSRTSLMVAGSCIVVWLPRSLLEGGFWLSFGAILGVVYLLPMFCVVTEKLGKWSEGMMASLGIQFIVLPVMLWNFHEISPYSIVANMIVIPCMSILLGLGIMGLIGSVFTWNLGVVLLKIGAMLIGFIECSCNLLLKLPYSRFIVGKPKLEMTVIYYILLGGMITIYNKWKNNKKYKLLVVAICLLPLLFFCNLKQHQLEVCMIDVGQGDCIYVQGPTGINYLIDGGSTDVKEVGKYRIEPCLTSLGVGTIDYAFISHGDADHMNGIEEMIVRAEVGIEIKHIVLCEGKFQDEELRRLKKVAMDAGIEVLEMEAGDKINEEELQITCLAPIPNYNGELGNASSMVLAFTIEELDLLFTGDIEGEGEEDLIEVLKSQRNTYEVLKVAHHGSNNSTTEEILTYVQPQIALISAGVDNAYGHPHKETIERLKHYTSQVYTTSENGAISLIFDDDNVQIRHFIQR